MLRELAQDIYLQDEFQGGNVGVINTPQGALLIDTPMLPPEARQWRAQLADLGITSIYGIVNTDYHPEHIFGNDTFMPTRVFGHELSVKPIAKYASSGLEQVSNQHRDQGAALAEEILNLTLHAPQISVGDRITLHLGQRIIELIYYSGHTPASLAVYVPQDRLLFAGDNVSHNEHPVMYQCDSVGWLETLVRIQAMDVDTIVPGVGPLCDKEDLTAIYDYIAEMRARAQKLFDEGASRRECVDKVEMLDWFPVPDDQATRIKRRRRENIERVYTEIRTASRRKRKR